jgi:hypothetical protein
MITFENEDKEFLQWLTSHEHGYVLNRRDTHDNYMVHTARCMHIYDVTGKVSYTVSRSKMCSDRLEELQAWASKKGFSVVECPTCRPYK